MYRERVNRVMDFANESIQQSVYDSNSSVWNCDGQLTHGKTADGNLKTAVLSANIQHSQRWESG